MSGGKHYGSKAGMAVFYFLLRLFGVLPAYGLLLLLLPHYCIFRPSAVRSTYPYLKHRFPQDSSIRRYFRAWKYLNHFGRTLIDQAALGILGPEKFRVDFPGERDILDRDGDKNGYVMAASHVGCWQSAMAFVRKMTKDVYFIMEVDNPLRKNDHFFDLAGNRGQFLFIDPHEFMGGTLTALNSLEQGAVVAVMGDRKEQWQTGIVRFLGEKAELPFTGPLLAALSGTSLIVLLTVRTGRYSFRADLYDLSEMLSEEEKGLKPRKLAGRYLDIYVRLLEEHVERYPYSWFNFFDFWSLRKNE